MDFEKDDIVADLNVVKARCFDELLEIAGDDDFDEEDLVTELLAMGKVIVLLEKFKVREERS